MVALKIADSGIAEST